jgi:hypothetical protein
MGVARKGTSAPRSPAAAALELGFDLLHGRQIEQGQVKIL